MEAEYHHGRTQSNAARSRPVLITVRREVVGKMSAALFAFTLLGFLLGALEPSFRPLVWMSLASGAVLSVLLWLRYRRSTHPTVSHIERDREESRPVHPR
jgi:hypothetical protein